MVPTVVSGVPPKTLRLPAPSEKKYVSMKDVSLSDAGKKVLPGQAALLFPPEEPPAPTTPPVLKDEEPSTPRGEDRSGPPPGWLDAQPEAVQAEYRAKVKRLKGVSIPDYEALALLRTWEEFRGNSR